MPSKLPAKVFRLNDAESKHAESVRKKLIASGIPCRSWTDLMRMGLKLIEEKFLKKG